jgi:hypothetical protein
MKSGISLLTAFLVSLFLFGNYAGAKDLNNRLGVGFSNSFSFNLPSIAGVYYPAG